MESKTSGISKFGAILTKGGREQEQLYESDSLRGGGEDLCRLP